MAKKITLSVPDELHKKMDKWRSSINFSNVFQKAINSIILTKEDFNKRIIEEINISDTLERLKKEKKAFEKKYMHIGKQFGMEWSLAAHYTDLIYAVSLNVKKDPTKDERLGSYFSDIFSNHPHLQAKNFIEHKNNAVQQFIDGWKYSVNEFWSEIRDKI